MPIRRTVGALAAVALATAALAAAGAAPAFAAAPGLVAAYGFDEGAGLTATDASGSGNAGAVSGATWSATGRYGGALAFDGVNDWVTVPDAASLDLTSGLTLEAWVNPATLTAAAWRTVLLKERSGDLSYALYANTEVNRPSGEAVIGGVDRVLRGTAQLPLGAWTHLALTYNAATLRFYVNGVQVATQTRTGTVAVGTGALRIGGNAVWSTEFFDGRIDEIRVYNRALTAAEIATDLATPVGGGTPPPVDTTPPTVAISAPAAGATVSGSVPVAASAADAGGVAGVQFRLDGAPLGAEDTTAPYGVTWNATGATPGGHTLAAVARDAAGNLATSAAVSVTVAAPTADAAVVGQWAPPVEWPLVAVHMMLLRTGRVLMFDGFGAAPNSNREWDPSTGAFAAVPYARNLFCSLHVALADGRIAIFGGHVNPYEGLADLTIYDPGTRTWSRGPDMARGRWYPTATMLADGRALVVSGDNITLGRSGQTVPLTNASNTLPEIYDPAADAWTQLPTASRWMPLYPFMFLLPDGTVFDAGPDLQTRTLDLTTRTWSAGITSPIDAHSAVMYRPGKILKSGTWADPDFPDRTVDGRAAVVDMTSFAPAWRETPAMAFPRSYHTLTVLPDGSVLASGGGRRSDGVNLSSSVYEAELWNPATETWTTMAAQQRGRLYHSSALLLPDGRVLVAGGGRLPGLVQVEQTNAEIYSPPYLFKGPRPTIASAPATVAHGGSFTVTSPDAARIASISLVRLGSVTHNVDADQRYVPLSFSRSGDTLSVEAPADANIAPPGYYMLFLVDSNGVPSIASMVRLPLGAAPPPGDTTPPAVALAAPAANATLAATVTVSADATDAGGIAGVQFTLDGASLGAEDTTAPYSVAWNTTLAANGAHVLAATARDIAGNTATAPGRSVTVTNAPPPPATGLVAAYAFDEGTGTTVADSSGTGNAGTISGATWNASGRFGSALGFDGVNDWVTVASNATLNLTSGLTLEAWVNPTTLTAAAWRTVVLKERPGDLAYGLYANTDTNRPSGHAYIGGADRVLRGTSQLPLGTWSHLALTYDAAALRFYVNGALVATQARTGAITTSTAPLRIGGNAVWSTEFFNGRIDEVRIYNRALTAAQIATDMTTRVAP